MSEAPAAFEVAFLDKLQRLLAEGDFTATYKFAVLLGLVELSVEAPLDTDTFTTRQLAEKVVELYWAQVQPFEDLLLLQNAHRQARIVTAVARFRDEAARTGLATLPVAAIAQRLPPRWERLLDEVEWSLVEMPLTRLQRLPSGTDEFIYSVSWSLSDTEERKSQLQRELRAVQSGATSTFDNRIQMRPDVVPTLARFHAIVRELVEGRWVRKVRELNDVELGDRDLYAHLFGIERAQLVRRAGPLRELQRGRCFYCDDRLVSVDIDHFLPWARYPENRLENLVAAHGSCNRSKAAHLAAAEHLDRWLTRFGHPGLADVARTSSWPAGGRATLAISRRLYALQPEDARLWFAPGEFREWRHADVEGRIALAEDRLRAV